MNAQSYNNTIMNPIKEQLKRYIDDSGTLYTKRIDSIRDYARKNRLSSDEKKIVADMVQDMLMAYDTKTRNQTRTAEYLTKLGSSAKSLLAELNDKPAAVDYVSYRPASVNYAIRLIDEFKNKSGKVTYNSMFGLDDVAAGSHVSPSLADIGTGRPFRLAYVDNVAGSPARPAYYSLSRFVPTARPNSLGYTRQPLWACAQKPDSEKDSKGPAGSIDDVVASYNGNNHKSRFTRGGKLGLFASFVATAGMLLFGLYSGVYKQKASVKKPKQDAPKASPAHDSAKTLDHVMKDAKQPTAAVEKKAVHQKTPAFPDYGKATEVSRNMPSDIFGYNQWHDNKTEENFAMMKMMNSNKTAKQKAIFDQWFGSHAKYRLDEQKKTLELDLSFIKGFPAVVPFAKGADNNYHQAKDWKHVYTNMTPEQIQAFKAHRILPSPIGMAYQSEFNGKTHRFYVSGFDRVNMVNPAKAKEVVAPPVKTEMKAKAPSKETKPKITVRPGNVQIEKTSMDGAK